MTVAPRFIAGFRAPGMRPGGVQEKGRVYRACCPNMMCASRGSGTGSRLIDATPLKTGTSTTARLPKVSKGSFTNCPPVPTIGFDRPAIADIRANHAIAVIRSDPVTFRKRVASIQNTDAWKELLFGRGGARQAQTVFIGRIYGWPILALEHRQVSLGEYLFLCPFIDAPPEEIVFCIDATPPEGTPRVFSSAESAVGQSPQLSGTGRYLDEYLFPCPFIDAPPEEIVFSIGPVART